MPTPHTPHSWTFLLWGVRAQVNGAGLWFDVLSPAVRLGQDELVELPQVIGVHGGPGINSTSLLTILTPLTNVAQVIRYDQRGHGRSDPGRPEQWTVDTWADDLAGLAAALGVDRPVLFGVSFGAYVALACAARYPEGVGGVVAAYGGGRMDQAATVEAFRRLGGDGAAEAAEGDPEDPEGSFQTWLQVCWPLRSHSPAGTAHLAHMQSLSVQSPQVHAVHARAAMEQEQLPNLDRITYPVLVLGGCDNPLSPPAVMTELAGALTASSRCDLVLVPDAGHTLCADQPDRADKAVRNYLDL